MDVKTTLLLTGAAWQLLLISARVFSAPLKVAVKVLFNTLLGLGALLLLNGSRPLHRYFPGPESVQRGGGGGPRRTGIGAAAPGPMDLYIGVLPRRHIWIFLPHSHSGRRQSVDSKTLYVDYTLRAYIPQVVFSLSRNFSLFLQNFCSGQDSTNFPVLQGLY